MRKLIRCPNCAELREHHAKGLCVRCYRRQWRGAKPVKPVCSECGRKRVHCAYGVCVDCYPSWRVKGLRLGVLKELGGKCVYCGCDIVEALEINHTKGGGRGEYKRRRSPQSLYKAILDGSRRTDDLELTCRPCNSVHYLEIIKKLPGHWEVKFNRTGGLK